MRLTNSRVGFGVVVGALALPVPFYSFFQRVYTHPPLRNTMPAKYTVALVLDHVTNIMWDELPAGERSKRVREALKRASIVNERDMLVEALRKQIKFKQRHLDKCELRLSLCKCKMNIGCHFKGNDFYFEELDQARPDPTQGRGEPEQVGDEE